ncbi:uncharacterized protein BDV14DRAFT_200513 [Aspergillus stella-maris]|uniref:uncharacterized protein n=1 Tax=Aspergillus stella-maris TaxID=1810926 RepID=UPI003CCE2E8B
MSDLNWWPIEHLNSSSANANLGSRLFDNASAHPLQPGALPLAKYDPRVAPQVFSPATLTFQSSAAFRSQTSGNSSRPIMRGAVAPGASAVPAAGIITSDLGFGSQRSLPIRHSVMTGSQNPQSASHTSQLYNEQQQLGLNYYDQLDPNVNNLPYVRGDHILQDGQKEANGACKDDLSGLER